MTSPARLLDDGVRDLRLGVRLLMRSPVFTTVAVLSLALGIGSSTALFSLVQAVLLRGLPVADPQQVYLAGTLDAPSDTSFSYPLYLDFRDAVGGRAPLCAASSPAAMQLSTPASGAARGANGDDADGAGDRPIIAQLFSGDCFAVFRQPPQAGRLLTREDDERALTQTAAVISDRFWTKQFARSAGAIGRRLTINGADVTIVGVAAAGFAGTRVELAPPDVWLSPLAQPLVHYAGGASFGRAYDRDRPWAPQRDLAWLHVFARVPDAADLAAVRARLDALARQDAIDRLAPDAGAVDRRRLDARRLTLMPAGRADSVLRQDARGPLLILSATSALLLLIACANLAGLLLARAAVRRREIAIRQAIGASRARLARQLLAESALLTAAGAALGLWLARVAAPALLALLLGGADVSGLDLRLDARALAFACAASIAAGLLCGLLPALRGTRVGVAVLPGAQARAAAASWRTTGASLPLGRTLAVAQIALAVLLLVTAGLFIRTFRVLAGVHTGFDAAHVYVGRLDPRAAGYTPQSAPAAYARLLDRLRAIPGVEQASLSAYGILAGLRYRTGFATTTYVPAADEQPTVQRETVTPDYFRTVGLALLRGRTFDARDTASSEPVSVINEALARRYFAGRDPLGRRWSPGGAPAGATGDRAFTIIGIVSDGRYNELRDAPGPMAYRPAAQDPDARYLTALAIRSSRPSGTIAAAVRAAVRDVDPRLPVTSFHRLDLRVAAMTRGDRALATLTTACGAAALALACLGLYGTLAYGVARRTREIGVRMALGARPADVRRLVLRDAALALAAGTAIGAPLAYAAARLLAARLYGVTPADLMAHAGAIAALIAAAGAAAGIPARRAARIDPMVALRED